MSNPNGNTNQLDYAFIGEGVIYGRKYGSTDPLIDFGNAESLNLSFSTDKKQLPNFRGGGGNRNVKELVTGVSAAIGMYDLTPATLPALMKARPAPVPPQPLLKSCWPAVESLTNLSRSPACRICPKQSLWLMLPPARKRWKRAPTTY